MSSKQTTRAARVRRHTRVRRRVSGTAQQPRLAVFRSNKHFVAQVIDDESGRTLAAASTLEADVKQAGATGSIDQLLAQVLATLGVGIGQADVWVTGVRCDRAVLVNDGAVLEDGAPAPVIESYHRLLATESRRPRASFTRYSKSSVGSKPRSERRKPFWPPLLPWQPPPLQPDRKSTRLNSSHVKRSRMPSSA